MPKAGFRELFTGWLALSGCFLLLAAPLLLTSSGNYVWDQDNYHVPAVLQIRAHWPMLDLDKDVFSAVAPGYHWFLAGVSRIVGAELPMLRAINLAVSLLALTFLFSWSCRYLRPMDSAILLLPLAASNFFVKAAAWVVTDNPALFLASIVLLGVLRRPTLTGVAYLGMAATGASFVRQTNAWLAGPLLLHWSLSIYWRKSRESAPRKAMALALSLGPIILIAWLYATWHGLVPPRWQEAAFQISTCAIAYQLVVFLVFSPFLFGFAGLCREIGRLNRWTFLASLAIGLTVAVASPTSYSYPEGRWGGYLWTIVGYAPSVWERSTFFLLLSPLGALALAGVWSRLKRESAPYTANVWIFSVICWSATFIVNRQVFHRYFEPMLLIFLVAALAASSYGNLDRAQRKRIAALALLQTAGTLATAWARSF
jgi:hypothetical protein